MVKQISDNEMYLLTKYIKSVLWRVAKRLSYIEDARCLKVNGGWKKPKVKMPRANGRRKEKCVQSVRKYKWYNRRKRMVDE